MATPDPRIQPDTAPDDEERAFAETIDNPPAPDAPPPEQQPPRQEQPAKEQPAKEPPAKEEPAKEEPPPAAPSPTSPAPTSPAPTPPADLFPDFDETDASEYDLPLARALNALKRENAELRKTLSAAPGRDEIKALVGDAVKAALAEAAPKPEAKSEPPASRIPLARPDGARPGAPRAEGSGDAPSAEAEFAAEIDRKFFGR